MTTTKLSSLLFLLVVNMIEIIVPDLLKDLVSAVLNQVGDDLERYKFRRVVYSESSVIPVAEYPRDTLYLVKGDLRAFLAPPEHDIYARLSGGQYLYSFQGNTVINTSGDSVALYSRAMRLLCVRYDNSEKDMVAIIKATLHEFNNYRMFSALDSLIDDAKSKVIITIGNRRFVGRLDSGAYGTDLDPEEFRRSLESQASEVFESQAKQFERRLRDTEGATITVKKDVLYTYCVECRKAAVVIDVPITSDKAKYQEKLYALKQPYQTTVRILLPCYHVMSPDWMHRSGGKMCFGDNPTPQCPPASQIKAEDCARIISNIQRIYRTLNLDSAVNTSMYNDVKSLLGSRLDEDEDDGSWEI